MMLQMLWHFLSSLFPGAGCQGSREGTNNEVRGTPAPAQGDQMSRFLGKQDGRAEAMEKRPTILLVVGPAEQFPKVTATSRGPSSLAAGLGTFSWKKNWSVGKKRGLINQSVWYWGPGRRVRQ